MVHTGAWGTPDFGITEWAQKTFAPDTAQSPEGGSDWNPISGGPVEVAPNDVTNISGAERSWVEAAPSGNVLGAVDTSKDTTSSATSGSSDFNRFDQNANPGADWGWHGTDGGWKLEGGASSGGVDTRALEDAYNRLQGIFGQQEETARGTATSANKSITDRFGSDTAKTEAEKAKMLRDIAENKDLFTESGFSALDQNIRDYNALEQRANVRYGGGSGVGDIMRELAAKELYRSQGGIRKQQVAGEADFANQMSDTELFISQKLGDLTLWKNEAMDEVQQRLSASLNTISTMRGESEINKEQQKLAALQTAQENASRITQADNQFKQGLLTNYLDNMATTMGRSLTPQEIASVVPQFMNIGLSGPSTGEAGPEFKTFNDEEDELNQLLPTQA